MTFNLKRAINDGDYGKCDLPKVRSVSKYFLKQGEKWMPGRREMRMLAIQAG